MLSNKYNNVSEIFHDYYPLDYNIINPKYDKFLDSLRMTEY